MSVQYDPNIIRKFADQLYGRANFIIAGAAVIGLVAGLILFHAIGAVVGLVIGLAIGVGLAFKYKLQAQVALCQVQIEENTRHLRRESGA